MPSAVDTIDASIVYIEDDPRFQTEKPYICLLPNPGFEPTNCQFGCSAQTTITDLRSLPSTIDFAEYGFTVVPHETCLRSGIAKLDGSETSEELVQYLEETRKYAQEYFKADQAICFDWRLRQASSGDLIEDFDARDFPLKRKKITTPAYKAHADFSPLGGWLALRTYLTEDEITNVQAKRLHVKIVSCWRPLVDKVEDVPLAFCRRGTVRDDDWITYDRVDGTDNGEGMFLKQNRSQEWFYFSNQSRDDLTIFECWDSSSKSYQGQIPHAAFKTSNPNSNAPARTSIEARVILWFDEIS